MSTPLSVALEAELLRRLGRQYAWANHLHFGNKLKAPLIALSDAETRLGVWKPQERRIEISRTLAVTRPWTEVTEVLLHEMAHQFVHECLRILDETAHGPAFQRICSERGIDARAAGIVSGNHREDGASRIVERVQKLLALAGSSERHEAEAAMRKAHELMLKYNLETLHSLAYEVRHLGDPNKRRTSMERDVISILTEFFFVEAIEMQIYMPLTGASPHIFEVCGTGANVAMAEHVFSFLLQTAERLWSEAKKTRKLAGKERVPFQSGVIRGFGEKLRAERQSLRGTGLVWVGDAQLERFYRARHPRIRRSTRSQRMSEGHALGREAGRNVVLNKPVTSGPSAGPRLLGGG